MYCGNNFKNNNNNDITNRMKTSTFPPSRSSGQSVRDGLKEIQVKRKALTSLELTLKARLNEFRELCLKEGELTGHLPIDYPLQPREPLPQIRRRRKARDASDAIFTPKPVEKPIENIWPIPKANPRSHDNLDRNSAPNIHSSNLIGATNSLNHMQPHLSNIDMKDVAKFQPYYEETKPFQMSDFYKYSSKHRQATNGTRIPESCKTTRQLQEEVLNKRSLDFSPLDERIMASVKVIERNRHELMKATAEAIALNPGLAEKLNHILPKSQT